MWVRDFKPLTEAALEVPTGDLARKWGTLYGAIRS